MTASTSEEVLYWPPSSPSPCPRSGCAGWNCNCPQAVAGDQLPVSGSALLYLSGNHAALQLLLPLALTYEGQLYAVRAS